MEKIKEVNIYFISVSRPMFFMFLIYFAYLLIGSICFVTFEAFEDIRTRNESAKQIIVARAIANTLMSAGFSKDKINLAFKQEKEVLQGTAKPKDVPLTQLYGEKLFFAFILITTIGYGNVSPSSQIGRLVCIAYTLFGMPIHVIMMRLLSYECRALLRRALRVAQKLGPSYKLALPAAGCLFFIGFLVIFILVPAYVFTQSDRWNYHLGVYFSFVSLTTIGLGDYVAGVSGEHLHDNLYSLYVVAMLVWLMLGLGFVFMGMNMLSYFLGVGIMDKVDCKCRKRTTAKRRMRSLLEVMKDLNWNLVKFTPPKFKHSADIEEFKELLVENPQDVTHEKLLEMFRIMTELREQAYDDLSRVMSAGIPMTPIIQKAKDNLPDILSQDSTTVTYSGQMKSVTFGKPQGRGAESSDLADLESVSSDPERDQLAESVPHFRFGSAVDLHDMDSASKTEILEDEYARVEDVESSIASSDEDEEIPVVLAGKDSAPTPEEERTKQQ